MKKFAFVLVVTGACIISSAFAYEPIFPVAVNNYSLLAKPGNYLIMAKPNAKKSSQKNVVEWSLLRVLTRRNINIGYERVLADKMSIAIEGQFRIPLGSIKQLSVLNEDQEIKDENGMVIGTAYMEGGILKGYAITPQFRFYPGGEAPAGFYLAPYLKYASHSLDWTATFDYTDITKRDEYADIGFKFNEFGGGLQLGYQWVVGPGFIIDWYFLGPRYSKFNMKFQGSGSVHDEQTYSDLEKEFYDAFKEIPIIGDNIKSSHTSNSVTVEAPFMFPNIRTGIAFGFAF